MTVLTRFDCTQFQLTFAHFSRLFKVSVKFSTEHQIAWTLAPVAEFSRLTLPSYFPAILRKHIRYFKNEKRTGAEMGSLLGKRRSAIGQFFFLSLVTAPDVQTSLQKLTWPSLLVCKVANFSKVHLLWSCPLLKRWSFPMTCLIFSLLDRPKSALQASARMQSASTSGVFTINKDNRTLIPLLERTHPHILVRMSSLLLNTARCFVWYLATAPLNCNNSARI